MYMQSVGEHEAAFVVLHTVSCQDDSYKHKAEILRNTLSFKRQMGFQV